MVYRGTGKKMDIKNKEKFSRRNFSNSLLSAAKLRGIDPKGNKKGIFFMMLTIIILSIFLLSATFLSGVALRKSIQKRVETLSDFVFATEEDLERQLFIFGFRTIFLIQEDILETNSPVTNASALFEEAFFNGTVNGQNETLLIDTTFNDIQSIIREKAQKISANITFSSPTISATHEDPWNVKVTFVSNFFVEDNSNLAFWNKTLVSVSYIPVEGFSDPLYTIKTGGSFPVNITKTPYKVFVSGSDISNLSSHLFNSYYTASTDAPSFMDRMEGKFSPNPNGIESLVNLQELANRGLQTFDKSVVDHIYFSAEDLEACNVIPPGMPSWFKLDEAHLVRYNVSCVGGDSD